MMRVGRESTRRNERVDKLGCYSQKLSTSNEIESKWRESRRISRDASPSPTGSGSASSSLTTPIEDLGDPIAAAGVDDFDRRWSLGVIDPQTLPTVDDVDLRVDIDDEVKMEEVDLRGVVGGEVEAVVEFEVEFALVGFMLRPRPIPRSRLWVGSNIVESSGRGDGSWHSALVGVSGQTGEVVELDAEAETGTEVTMGVGRRVSGPRSSLKENKLRRLSLEEIRLAVLGVGDEAESRSWSWVMSS